jgi:hypothetical protein
MKALGEEMTTQPTCRLLRDLQQAAKAFCAGGRVSFSIIYTLSCIPETDIASSSRNYSERLNLGSYDDIFSPEFHYVIILISGTKYVSTCFECKCTMDSSSIVSEHYSSRTIKIKDKILTIQHDHV